jgi:hypothetical protein
VAEAVRGGADGQREQAADQCDPGELAVEGADQDVDVEGDDHAGEHRIGDDRAPAHAAGSARPKTDSRRTMPTSRRAATRRRDDAPSRSDVPVRSRT